MVTNINAVALWVPVDQEVLNSLVENNFTEWCFEKTFSSFYATRDYAVNIAKDISVATGAGYVLKLRVEVNYLTKFFVQKMNKSNVGGYVIPDKDVDEFKSHIIVNSIENVDTFINDKVKHSSD